MNPFGRIATLTKPGERPGEATLQFEYYDWEVAAYGRPVRYRTLARWGGNGGATRIRNTTTFYDGLGRRIQEKVSSGTAAAPQDIISDWRYDGLSRVGRIQVGNVLDRGYQYDPVGNVAQITNYLPGQQQSQTFTYDARDRLTRAQAG